MKSSVTSRKQRFWALLLAVVMVVGLLPTAGVKAIDDQQSGRVFFIGDLLGNLRMGKDKQLIVGGDRIVRTDETNAESPQYLVYYYDDAGGEISEALGEGNGLLIPEGQAYLVDSYMYDGATDHYEVKLKPLYYVDDYQDKNVVIFETDYGQAPDHIIVGINEKLSPMSIKDTEDYHFVGWKYECGEDQQGVTQYEIWNFDKDTVTSDKVSMLFHTLVLYATWEPRKYNINFDLNEDSLPADETIDNNDITNISGVTYYQLEDDGSLARDDQKQPIYNKVLLRPAYTKNYHYVVAGWKWDTDDAEAEDVYFDNGEITIKDIVAKCGDITTINLIAEWEPQRYGIKFENNCPEDMDPKPLNPQDIWGNADEETGYSMGVLYTDSVDIPGLDGDEKYGFAGWVINTSHVFYEDTEDEDRNIIDAGENIPVKDIVDLYDAEVEWYYGENGTGYVFVSGGILLHGTWKTKHTVTFDLNGHGTLDEGQKKQVVLDREKAKAPDPKPRETGWIFKGWKLYNAETKQVEEGYFDFETPIEEDIELLADWEKASIYTIQFHKGHQAYQIPGDPDISSVTGIMPGDENTEPITFVYDPDSTKVFNPYDNGSDMEFRYVLQGFYNAWEVLEVLVDKEPSPRETEYYDWYNDNGKIYHYVRWFADYDPADEYPTTYGELSELAKDANEEGIVHIFAWWYRDRDAAYKITFDNNIPASENVLATIPDTAPIIGYYWNPEDVIPEDPPIEENQYTYVEPVKQVQDYVDPYGTVQMPKAPQSEKYDPRHYNFLGWKVSQNDVDGADNEKAKLYLAEKSYYVKDLFEDAGLTYVSTTLIDDELYETQIYNNIHYLDEICMEAVWEAKPYDIIFNANTEGMDITPVPEGLENYALNGVTYENGETIVVLPSFATEEYGILGWSLDKDSDTIDFIIGEDYTVSDIILKAESLDYDLSDGQIEIYAIWGKYYRIIYDPNGGIGNLYSDQSIENDIFVAISNTLPGNEKIFTNPGYHFVGWNTKRDGSGNAYPADEKTNIKSEEFGNGNVLYLYAQWEPEDYTVIFYANAEDAENEMGNQTFAYGVAQNLYENKFEREKYTFIGWATEPNGEKEYDDKQEVNNLTTEKNGVVKLYAVWEKNYEITFYRGYPIEDQDVKNYSEAVGKIPNWVIKGSPDSIFGFDPDDDLYTLENCHIVSFDVITDVKTNESGGVITNCVRKSDYPRFTYEDITSDKITYADIIEIGKIYADENKVIHLAILWAPNKYDIKFVVNPKNLELTVKGNYPDYSDDFTRTVTYDDDLDDDDEYSPILIDTTGKYTFAGWAYEENAAEAVYDTVDDPINFYSVIKNALEKYVNESETNGNDYITLYAVWSEAVYAIWQDDNGNELYKAEIRPNDEELPPYKGEIPEKENYDFEWDEPARDNKGNTVIKAKFNPKKYGVKFIDDDNRLISETKYDYGTEAAKIVIPDDPTKVGYTFTGWTPAIADVTGNATYTATYDINKYTVTWKNEDGTVLETDKDVEYGTDPKYDGATPTKAEDDENTYEFKEWTPKLDKVTADVTYTATYSANKKVANGGNDNPVIIPPAPTKYTITWKNIDGAGKESTTQVAEGTVPAYNGTPSKAADADYTYTFKGWTPTIVAATGDATYTAEFTATKKENNNYNNPTPSPTPTATPTPTPTPTPAAPQVYNIEYYEELEDGTVVQLKKTMNPDTYTYGVGAVIKYGIDKEGYKFNGWYSKRSKKYVDKVSETTKGTVKLYARFLPIDDGNGNGGNESAGTPDSEFGILCVRLTDYTEDSMTLMWDLMEGVDGYDIFGSRCNSKDVIRPYEPIDSVDANTDHYVANDLLKQTYYKFYVRAYILVNNEKRYITTSINVHGVTLNEKYGVADDIIVNKVVVKGKKSKTKYDSERDGYVEEINITMKVGQTLKIVASEYNADGKEIRAHRPISFESSKPDILKVGKKKNHKYGVEVKDKANTYKSHTIFANAAGECTIYVFAQNGLYTKVNVTVKE